MSPHFGMPPFFSLFMVLFVVVFIVIIGTILFNLGRGVSQWASNNAQSVRTDEAAIVSKRTDVSGGQNSTSTTYYATFELADRSRKELEVDGADYGQFAEGDRGTLQHQGARFLGFSRSLRQEPEPPRLADSGTPAHLVCDFCGGAIPKGEIKCHGCGWTWKPGKAETAGRQS